MKVDRSSVEMGGAARERVVRRERRRIVRVWKFIVAWGSLVSGVSGCGFRLGFVCLRLR